MNRYAPFFRRAQRRFRTEVALTLDGGVSFLIEDDWRCPWSDHPNRPRRRKPYGHGKQVWAAMAENTAWAQLASAVFLPHLQAMRQQVVAQQQRAANATRQERLAAALDPRRVDIEPTSSVLGVQGVVAELERRTHLPIEEIRAAFCHGGDRRSAEARKVDRSTIEHAIIETVRHHRMVHPCFDRQDELGLVQWGQAREVWREFVGQSVGAQRDRQLCMETFGDWEDEDGETRPVEYDWDDRQQPHQHQAGRRAARSQRRPQILPRVAEALGVTPRAIEKVLASSSHRTPTRVGGHSLSPQEAS